MPIAISTIRRDPHYRRQAFDAGLESLGYRLEQAGRPKSKADLLVVWNRQLAEEQQADDWERQGGTVIVCENAYLAPTKWSMYAISVHGHCGSGWFPVDDEDRFAALGIEPEPWRADGGHVLVCGQRGIGSKTMASPRDWELKIAQRLKAMGLRVVVRRHPGRFPTKTTFDEDLRGASLCVIWSSACGVQALVRGVSVAWFAPHWIGSAAAPRGYDGVTRPLRSDTARSAALRHMAHGQWTVEEIESGEPFRRILVRLGEASW